MGTSRRSTETATARVVETTGLLRRPPEGPLVNIRSPRAIGALIIGTLIIGTLVAGAALTAVAQPAEASVYVKNPDFSRNTSHWTASEHASKSRVRVSIEGQRTTAGQIQNKKSRKARDIRLTSSLSPSAIPNVNTAVRSSARVKTSRPGKIVTYRVYELYGNRVVSSGTTRVKAKSGWFWVRADLNTSKPRTQLRVSVQLDDAKRGQYLRLTDVTTTVTAPPVAELPTKPTPKPTVKPTPKPTTPGTTPTPAPTTGNPPSSDKCEDVDYKDPAQGKLSYADEFNGTALDPKQWRVRDNTFLNQDAAYIDKDNVSVHDGYLDIRGKREPEANWRSNPNALYGEENRVRKYSTGYVDSIKNKTSESPDAASSSRFSQKYGYFEARMLVPSTDKMSQGIWPAFWLRADKVNGEIDVMESYGSPTIRKNFDPSPSYEWNSWEDTSQVSTKNHFLGRPAVTEPIHKTWHTYGVNWSPSCLRYTLDGKTVGMARPIAGETPYINGPTFDSPFHVRLNMQIGSKYWGWPDSNVTRDEFSFKVDYVRAYQAHS
jgi:beta-glucanase (GH16 family)